MLIALLVEVEQHIGKGCPSKNVPLDILFSFVSASEQPIFTILVPISHNYGYVRGVGIRIWKIACPEAELLQKLDL